jgi:hypothetical protein
MEFRFFIVFEGVIVTIVNLSARTSLFDWCVAAILN